MRSTDWWWFGAGVPVGCVGQMLEVLPSLVRFFEGFSSGSTLDDVADDRMLFASLRLDMPQFHAGERAQQPADGSHL